MLVYVTKSWKVPGSCMSDARTAAMMNKRSLFLDGSSKWLIRAERDILKESWSALDWRVMASWCDPSIA